MGEPDPDDGLSAPARGGRRIGGGGGGSYKSWSSYKSSSHGYPTRYKVRNCVWGWVRSAGCQKGKRGKPCIAKKNDGTDWAARF